MKTTNKFNLPDLFCTAVAAFESDYDRGDSDFTVTELIKPARLAALSKHHWNELTEDVSERAWALDGQIGHLLFERLALDHPERYYRPEHRYIREVNGRKISARVDMYDAKELTLWDYKNTSVWKFVLGDTREWEEQLNMARYCAPELSIKHLKVFCRLKDWKAREADKGKEGYPVCPVHIVTIPIWEEAFTSGFISGRIAAHEAARKAVESGKPTELCRPDERWERGEKWAVMKKGNKRAVKLYDTEEQAGSHVSVEWANTGKTNIYVEHRPAEPTRCLYYCPVAQFCDFGRRALGIDSGSNGPDTSIEH